MNFYNEKFVAAFLILIIAFSNGCQPRTENENGANQKIETNGTMEIRVSATETDAAEPAIAADKSGNIYVVFVKHEADKSADIYLQKFDSNKKLIGEKTRVNPEKGQAKAWFGDQPTIKIGTDDRIYIGWTAKNESADKPNANVLYLSVSRDGGKSFDAPVKVNDDFAPVAHGMHSLAIDENNRVFMAWLDERNLKGDLHAENSGGVNANKSKFEFVKANHNPNEEEQMSKNQMKHEAAEPNSEIFFASSADGGNTFAPNKKLSSEVCPCCKTSLVVAPDGKIYASWRQVVGDDFRHIAVASSVDNGQTFSNYTIVSDDKWQINACPVSGATMAIDEKNALKIIWFTAGTAGKPGIYEAESNDFGKTFANRRLIFEGAISGTPNFTVGENAAFKIVWESAGKIYTSQIQLNQNKFSEPRTIGDGKLPSSVAVGSKVFFAFIKDEAGKRAVWLAEI